MGQLDGHRQVATMVKALKQMCRMRGLRYREIASLLDVTERTVKRWFAGSGLTLQIVEDLCNVLGITFMDLCDFAKEDLDTRPNMLAREQARQLFTDLQLGMVFVLLSRGWLPHEIQRECHMSDTLIVEHLTKLDKLKLIELLPGNRIRRLYSSNIRWDVSSEAGKAFQRGLGNLFSTMNFAAPSAMWAAHIVHVSAETLKEILSKYQKLSCDIEKQSDLEKVGDNIRSWQVILMAAQPFDPLSLSRGDS